jgi:hypothetical protein
MLFGKLEQTVELLIHAEDYLQKLKWQAETNMYTPTGNPNDNSIVANRSKRLVFSRDSKLEYLFHKRFKKSVDQVQADLFMDSPATTLFNRITQALCTNDPDQARELLEKLFDTAPDHARLGELEELVDALHTLKTAVTDPTQELALLKDTIAPIAKSLLRKDSRDFLIPLWRRLTKALDQQPFCIETPELHASYTAMQSMDWETVKISVETDPSWKTAPTLITRHALACERLHLPGKSLLSWFELCWLFPQQAEMLSQAAGNEVQQYWQKFQDLDPELPEQDFPAWLILKKPSLLNIIPQDINHKTEFLKSYQTLCQLVSPTTNQLSSAETIALRAHLKKSNPVLFQHYIVSRTGN